MTKPYEQHGFKNLTSEEEEIFNRYGPDCLHKTLKLISETVCYHRNQTGQDLSDEHKRVIPRTVLSLLNEGETIEDIVLGNQKLLGKAV